MRQTQVARAQQQVSRPQLIQSMIDAMRVPDLRGKILFTLGMLVIFRFRGARSGARRRLTGPIAGLRAASPAGVFSICFSGGALANLSVAALGVYPYITASIVMQILTPVMPNLKALAQEGEYGRQRINQITHWLTVSHSVPSGLWTADAVETVRRAANDRLRAEPTHAGDGVFDGGPALCSWSGWAS